MRIGLLTDGSHPYATGESRLWCGRLARGLPQHAFDLFVLSRSAHQEGRGWVRLPDRVGRVRTAPQWTPEDGTPRGSGERGLPARLVTGGGVSYGRRDRKRFAAHPTALTTALCATEDAGPDPATDGGLFTEGRYGLAELARERGGPHLAPRSETTVRILEAAFRARGTGRTVRSAPVVDHLAFAPELERVLRPLPLGWYDPESLGAVDLCHAASGGAVALPVLLAKRFFGVPLLVTEHGVQLRTHYLRAPDAPFGAPVRALLGGLHAHRAAEVHRQAAIVTSGNIHLRRRQRRCGADPAKQRTAYPGMAAERFAPVGEHDDAGGPDTLVRVGRIEPAQDLIGLLHSSAEVRRAEPDARLRNFGAPADDDGATPYLAHCRRVEVIGGTGLVVPPRNPRALADARIALLRDSERRARLGVAVRARALELFTVEQNLAAFHGIYLELISHAPMRREADAVDADGEPLLYATPAEARLLGHRTPAQAPPTGAEVPSRSAGAGAGEPGGPGPVAAGQTGPVLGFGPERSGGPGQVAAGQTGPILGFGPERSGGPGQVAARHSGRSPQPLCGCAAARGAGDGDA
ncbi:DUF3492 domain-containing protein [Streptomyces sp. NPDC088755]|uniref:DUF3492 domain-containing protein n=1 Tax=Streptomyces sp. NPDC088755 TaxID=3365888 RepID=UPI00380D0B77